MTDDDIKYVNPEDLAPYEKNARTHSSKQIALIADSIRKYGFVNPVLVNADNMILAGHGRVAAAKALGLDNVPCRVISHLTKEEQREYILADNRLAELAGWDLALLSDELKDIGDIGALGFDDSFLIEEDFIGRTDEDAVPDAPETPVSMEGDIWQLGRHRLMCGDSTDAGSVALLMDGAKADMVFTDPPYGINEEGDRSNRGGKGKGGLADAKKYKSFVDDSIEYAVKAFDIVQDLGVDRQVWWGANYYAHHIPQSNNWFVWDKRVEDKHKDTQSDCELAWVKSKWSSVRIFRHLWKGMMKDSERGKARVHPTQKPVELAIWSFDYFKSVDTVLDLFVGSGSTLIACEKSNRICYGMELDPHYVDVIIQRWEDFTGQQATLDGKDYATIKAERGV